MRLRLDENLPDHLTDEPARRGHDVATVLDGHLGGRKDPVVVRAATDENRIVITLTAAWATSAVSLPQPRWRRAALGQSGAPNLVVGMVLLPAGRT